MDASEEKSQLLDLGHPSDRAPNLEDPPIISDDKLLEQILAQEFENLAISCKDKVLNRDAHEHDEEGELKRAIDEEVYHLVMKEAGDEAAFRGVSSSSVGGDENEHPLGRSVDEAFEGGGVEKVIQEDPTECRVLEVDGVDENGSGVQNEVKEVIDNDEKFAYKDADLKRNHEIEIEISDERGSVEVLQNEYDDERSENGEDRYFKNESVNVVGVGEGEEGGPVDGPNDGKPKRYPYPLRPDAEDCSYYMRTGMCKFGSNCKFNHPLRRKNQAAKEMIKHKEENSDKSNQIECKVIYNYCRIRVYIYAFCAVYALLAVKHQGGCKYGKACKYNHSKGRTAITPVAEYNFLGLPIRLGEKECPYYMRNGSCKYGPNCRFNHPDPTAVVGGDAPVTYGNGGSIPLQSPSQTSMSSWPAPRTPSETALYAPMIYSSTHSIPPPIPDWNGYQAPAPVYPTSERSLPTPPAFVMNSRPSDTSSFPHHQQPMLVSNFPERPGQLECSYYMKTGDCKYRSACKFHHPKSRVPKTATSVLSDKGLPIRPDQNICTHYSRYGICKYGPACKYDHPINYSNSATAGGYRPGGSDESLIQQQYVQESFP